MELPDDFEAETYLRLNPDVKAAGVDPVNHYLNHGRREGRAYKQGVYDQDGLRSIHSHEFMSEPGFVGSYERGVKATQGNDYRWHWRVHIALWAAEVASRLEGDFVECGVNFGFLSSAIMHHLDWNQCGKTFYLLDTFSGLDFNHVSESDLECGAFEKNASALESGFYATDAELVKQNFSEWMDRICLIEGSIPGTLSRVDAEKIAYIHLDLNCSEPEIDALEFFWDRIVPGAPILLDDYAYHGYRSQKVAMDEFSRRKSVPIASLPTGQGLMLKPPASKGH